MNALTQTFPADAHIHPGPIGSDSEIPIFDRAMKVLKRWRERATQRRHLAILTPRELDDVGISSEAAAAEAAKFFWQA